MPADRREHALELLRGPDGLEVGFLVEADRQDPRHAHALGVGNELGIRRVADPEMGVAVDHGASSFGNSGGIRSTVWPPPREPNDAISRESSPSAARSRSEERGM